MAEKEKIDVSIIIVNWNTKDLLRKCIQSIYHEMESHSFEIIIIDNNSEDGSPDMVTNEFPGVRFIANRDNVGFGRANNQGYQISSGKYLLILNPDTEILDHAIDHLIRFMDENPHIGVCGPRCIHPDGTVQVSWASFPSIKTIFTNNVSWLEAFSMFGFIRKIFKSDAVYTNDGFTVSRVIPRQRVDYVLGQCMLTRKSIVDQTGLFDEDVFMYEEEADLCYRELQAGYETWFVPEFTIIHHERKSINQIPNYLKTEMAWFMEARSRFYEKYYGNFYKYLFFIVTFISSLIKMFLMAVLWCIEVKKRKYFKMKLMFHCYILRWYFPAGK